METLTSFGSPEGETKKSTIYRKDRSISAIDAPRNDKSRSISMTDPSRLNQPTTISRAVSSGASTTDDSDKRLYKRRVDVTVESMFDWIPNSEKEVELRNNLIQEANYLNPTNYDGSMNLPDCYNGQIIPVYGEEPSTIIAYSLRSIEFLAAIN
eukprot:UN33754